MITIPPLRCPEITVQGRINFIMSIATETIIWAMTTGVNQEMGHILDKNVQMDPRMGSPSIVLLYLF